MEWQVKEIIIKRIIKLEFNQNFFLTENYKARVRLIGRKYISNGQTYVHFDKIKLNIIPGTSKIELKNLFDNNPTLKTIGNHVVSENSQNFISDIIPTLERTLGDIFTKAANDVVRTASWDEMFPNI